MDFNHFLAQYGYLALFIGCLLEGETLLLLAGVAAHQGYLSFPFVVLTAFCAGTLGDQGFFWLGRGFGMPLIRKFPQAERRIERMNQLLEQHQRMVIVGIRFMYGLRIIGPMVLGSSKVRARAFIAFNMIGAAIWATLCGCVGYLCGQSLDWVLKHLNLLGGVIALIVLTAGLLWRFLHQRAR